MIKVDRKGFLTFEKKISERSLPGKKTFPVNINHEELAKLISHRSFDCASILVVCNRLQDCLMSNPKYMRIDNQIESSQLQLDAIKELQGKYPTIDEIKKIIKRYKIPTRKNNYDLDDRSFYYQVENRIYSIFEQMIYPRIIFDKKQQFETKYFETHLQATKEEFVAEWKKELIDYLMPTVNKKYSRIYNLPHPLNQWDDRSPWQQWYFVNYGEEIRYDIGGTSSSGKREVHGRWAHTFATLEKKYHMSIPVYCFKYTSDNQFKLIKRYERFKAVRNDIISNYPVEWSGAKKLFKNKLLLVDSKTLDIKDVMENM